jgi:hypothetical protein
MNERHVDSIDDPSQAKHGRRRDRSWITAAIDT